MITEKSSGAGTYSYQRRGNGTRSIQVSHMPEDLFSVRIQAFTRSDLEFNLKMSSQFAELLWSALNGMAEDMGWEDRIAGEGGT